MPAVPERVFITGALGFVGRRLLERYREAGSQVAGLDVRADSDLDVVAGDITTRSWEGAARGADVVIHTRRASGCTWTRRAFGA